MRPPGSRRRRGLGPRSSRRRRSAAGGRRRRPPVPGSRAATSIGFGVRARRAKLAARRTAEPKGALVPVFAPAGPRKQLLCEARRTEPEARDRCEGASRALARARPAGGPPRRDRRVHRRDGLLAPDRAGGSCGDPPARLLRRVGPARTPELRQAPRDAAGRQQDGRGAAGRRELTRRGRSRRLEPAAWWSIRRAQNRKPATYTCPLCGGFLPALSEHMLLVPEGDSTRRRHAHAACVMSARRAGRLPTRGEYLRSSRPPRERTGLLGRLLRRSR